jgi:hypothetical protein
VIGSDSKYEATSFGSVRVSIGLVM